MIDSRLTDSVGGRGRSSGRSGLRPYMRLPLSRHDRALPTMVAQRISRRTVVDWGSPYPQRALHNLTYGPIAGRGTLAEIGDGAVCETDAQCSGRRRRAVHPRRDVVGVRVAREGLAGLAGIDPDAARFGDGRIE